MQWFFCVVDIDVSARIDIDVGEGVGSGDVEESWNKTRRLNLFWVWQKCQ